MVKRRDTLRAPSSRTRPAQKTSPLLILFIDLLSFKLETSQVVEVFGFFILLTLHLLTPRFAVGILAVQHLLFPFPPPSTHGQRRPFNVPRLPPTPSPSDAGFLPYPSSLALTLSRRRYAFPHVFRFNGCWSSFRLLLFAFRRFRSFLRSLRSRFPRTGHPLTLFTLILRMRTPPTRPLCGTLLARISLSVVSFQSLSRTALNVSLLRYIAFVFRLLVCLVPSHGGHGHV